MMLPGFLTVNQKLAVAIWLEKYLGVRFVLHPVGFPVPAVEWDTLLIELSKVEIIWLMNLCADVGGSYARSDLLFLRSVLAELP